MRQDYLENIIYALNNNMRREIIKVISNKSKTVSEISEELGKNRPLYRQSINRSLEILRECGLLSKSYSVDDKALYYSLNFKKLIIDLSVMEINVSDE